MADEFKPNLERLESEIKLPVAANLEEVREFLPPKDKIALTAKMAGAAVRQAAQAVAAEIARLTEDAERELQRVVEDAKTFADDVVKIGDEHAGQIEHALMQIRGVGERIVEERKMMAETSYPIAIAAKPNGDASADSRAEDRG